ncbi:hypothetical protein H5200_07315 [Pseudoalteromonas sp. SG43-7]|uniref:hypothetical protein n=1 Tax=unclassified Pseudoalteromonas TaxID=194690 RepID=UPI001601F602|nr:MULTISPECIES: hypothetical protein [unclassified Pseudoalteromonas]MBB1334151.1 hypothetical protein [Pseudoalteromonas sp. SR41-6]MBB1421722.1 hypothetical protein [Pseudoalteromonas sp. SG43-7]MBB1459765.1 hypothetical protein [Pseudoalteromonas sp. SG41-8]MBB1479705.1 hypothetical protein [Pseudoalteromonas sp. SG41-2]
MEDELAADSKVYTAVINNNDQKLRTQKWDMQNKSVISELNNLLTLSDSEYQARLMQQCYDDDKKLYYCLDSHCAKINRKNDC